MNVAIVLMATVIQNHRSLMSSPGVLCRLIRKMLMVSAIAVKAPTMREIAFLDIPASSKAVRIKALQVFSSRGQRQCLCSEQVSDENKNDNSRIMSPELRFQTRDECTHRVKMIVCTIYTLFWFPGCREMDE